MEDYQSRDEDYQYSDQGSLDDLVCEEDPDSKLVAGTAKGPTIKVITKETLLTAQEEDLCRIMDMLSVKKHQARALLIFHRWNMEKLFAEFVEKGKILLFAEAGVSEEHCYSGSSVASSIMCEICKEDVLCDQATRMDCDHGFCNNCWREYFIVKINEGQSKLIRCMAHKCKYYCDEDVVRTLVSQKNCDMAEKFERFLIESYVEDNKRAKWCPSTTHCGNAIYVEDDELCEVECSCGFQFCFSSLSEAHSPCSCLMRELWDEKCVDEFAAAWMKNNTKPCPKCHELVHKSFDCNMVSCICGQTFCWLCVRRYKDQEEKAEVAKQYESRYAHYHDRFKAHMMDSLYEERRLAESVRKKAYFPKDCSWVNDGLSTLVRSRRFLSYSYPFAFYMFGGYLFEDEISDKEKVRRHNLFKDYQQQLEENVEKLSEILEKPFESNKVSDIRRQVINMSAVIDSFCEGMYEFIQNDLLGSLSHGIHRIAPYKLLKQ